MTSRVNNPHEYVLQLTMAIDYGGRAEIADTARRLAVDVRDGKLAAEAVDEQTFDEYLRSESVSDPDLIIRTGGQKRVSNFLLWQSAYSEIYFSDTLWPDFDEEQVAEAFRWYGTRKRTYGLVK
uniref:Alkyl transferase n=2 Tax=Rhodosorus marinus TaxID=101924 RepID=A0A7S3ABR4_9RHOD|mmetsp:Transcript_9119/g.40050  ORF Transcript_9119/g.40050 Transcript_9119/m.40050 type:complete len:124 (+) Transcript_9119:444-815(+)